MERLSGYALVSLLALVGGTLLYPDTFATAGLHLGSVRVSPLGVLLAMAAPVLVLVFWVNRRQLRFRSVDAALLAMSVYLLANGLVHAQNSNEKALVVAYVAYMLLVYYGAAVIAQDEGTLRKIFITIAVLAIVIAAYALLEFALNRSFLYEELTREKVPVKSAEFHRSGSSLGMPPVLGTFLVQVLPFLAFLYTRADTRASRMWWSIGIVLAVLGLLTSFAKGAWMVAFAMAAGLSVWGVRRLLVHADRKSLAILVILSLLIISLFVIIFYDNIAYNLFSNDRRVESFTVRIYLWEMVPEAFLQNPWFGAGVWQGDNSLAAVEMMRTTPGEPLYLQDKVLPIDNLYLTWLVEWGVVGIILIGATLLLTARQAWQVLRRWGSLSKYALPMTVSLAAVLLSGMSFDSLMVWPNMVVFWLGAGLLRAVFEFQGGSQVEETAC